MWVNYVKQNISHGRHTLNVPGWELKWFCNLSSSVCSNSCSLENFGTLKWSHRAEKYEKACVGEFTDMLRRTATHQCCLSLFWGLIFLDQPDLLVLDRYTGSQPPTLMSDASTCSLSLCFSTQRPPPALSHTFSHSLELWRVRSHWFLEVFFLPLPCNFFFLSLPQSFGYT